MYCTERKKMRDRVWCATDRDLKHLPRVTLATCQLPVFLYARLPINSSATRQVRYPSNIFESICLKPIKKHIKPLCYCFYTVWGWPNSRRGHIFTHRRRCVMPLDTAKLDFYVLLFLFCASRSLGHTNRCLFMLRYYNRWYHLYFSFFFFVLFVFFSLSLYPRLHAPRRMIPCCSLSIFVRVFQTCISFSSFFMLKIIFPI